MYLHFFLVEFPLDRGGNVAAIFPRERTKKNKFQQKNQQSEVCFESDLAVPSEICGLLKALCALCSWASVSCSDGSLVPIPVGNKHVEARIIQFRYANLLCILEL